MDQKEKRKRVVEIGGEILHLNCETFEEQLTAIGPVITKTADRKTIVNYPYAWSNEENYHRL